MHINRQKNQFSKLSAYYLLALSAIALSIIGGQVFIQQYLHRQESDAHVINLAGRQRMLSQEISKLALQIKWNHEETDITGIGKQLANANKAWLKNNNDLKNGRKDGSIPKTNDQEVNRLFQKNDEVFKRIFQASTALENLIQHKTFKRNEHVNYFVKIILEDESKFLANMDKIVYRYEQLAFQKVMQLKRVEYSLLAVALLVILLEIFLIFIPTTNKVTQTLVKLIKSENDAQQMSKEISALYSSLEESYHRISGITLPVNPPRLIAKADKGGNITFISPLYLREFRVSDSQNHQTVAHLFDKEGEDADDFNEELIDTVANEKNWHKELSFKDKKENKRYLDIYVIPIYGPASEVDGLEVLASDMTARRLAEQDMYKKDRAEIDRKINEQKFRSILVLEGQEEERKRIAMNIHDGIGQMLTSLKFHMASIDLKNTKEAKKKLEDINSLTKEVIQEVRRVTFNLKPPVLSDYGLAAGLKNLVQEIDRLSVSQLQFNNLTDFHERLPAKVENNAYRIVQEALNNAIKYASSAKVEVLLEHNNDELVITVKDFGKGFERKEMDIFHMDFGHGFLNMQERAAYINGRLQIESAIGLGTIVKLFVPLKTKP